MKQCGHYTPSTAESASIINAPYKCLSQRIKELKDKLKALIMKREAFSATNGSSLLNMHHTGKCWRLQEYYHLSHPSAQRERRLVTEFSSQILISATLVKIWNSPNWLQSLHRHHRASGQTLLGGALTGQVCSRGRTTLLSGRNHWTTPLLKTAFNQPLSQGKTISHHKEPSCFLPPIPPLPLQ